MMTRWLRILQVQGVSFFLLASVLLGPALTWAQGLEKVRIGIPVVAMSQLPILMGQEKKIFQAEGFDPEVIQIRTALALPAMVAGELDFATSAETTIRSAVSGMPLKAIGFIGIRSSLVLVVQPRINKVTDLKGGKIAVSSLRTTTDFVARDILKYYGLNPEKDIVTLPLGSEANKIASVKSGAVDGAILTLPDDSIAEEQGLKKLVFAGDIVEGLQSGLATSVKKINENPAQVKRMARAFVKSLDLSRTDRNAAVDFIVKQWKVSRKVAGGSYDLMVKTFSPDGEAPEKLIRNLVDQVKRAQKVEREVALSEVVDFSFVREARKR